MSLQGSIHSVFHIAVLTGAVAFKHDFERRNLSYNIPFDVYVLDTTFLIIIKTNLKFLLNPENIVSIALGSVEVSVVIQTKPQQTLER